jgi:hypothetical protein
MLRCSALKSERYHSQDYMQRKGSSEKEKVESDSCRFGEKRDSFRIHAGIDRPELPGWKIKLERVLIRLKNIRKKK